MRSFLLKARAVIALAAVLAMMSVTTGCPQHRREKEYVHVPRVRYLATFEDKNCRQISKTPPRFHCNHVDLNPTEIDASGTK